MRVALVNPRWSFGGSIYFGCREPHLPLEFGYSKTLLERAGHEVLLVDGHIGELSDAEIRARVAAFEPGMTALATAPSYLFWRCPQPELRVPLATAVALRDVAGVLVAVGPHGSTTPRAALAKLEADIAVLGECEEVLLKLADDGGQPGTTDSIAFREGREIRVRGPQASADMSALPALHWPRGFVARHAHHHHRFDAVPDGPGAELEASRGCPYHCTFCAKDNFRDKYRRRPLATILEELDGLIAQGVTYVYFIDEIFQPNVALLEALVERPVSFGVQLRIDLWTPQLLELLGRAGCRSIEAGVESISELGRQIVDKKCRKSTEELGELLVHARRHVPFVQASLMDAKVDDAEQVRAWREHLARHGVWANEPVPLFPYPGSPDYVKLWGLPDDQAWERAHARYLELHEQFSDIQEERPLPLPILEAGHAEIS
ncbi:MAG: TIGR04295 family B12-binding domain-containing radical SAM protein [Acidobacteria bacterium]|nr:TIGR04295 family B12-binding domain-containing radical SAM protein [Acidobacteriota bacterium]